MLWGHRVVIPPQGWSQVLQELHESHPGISRMKSLARSFVWWPGMDDDILQGCVECQGNQKLPAKSPLQPWEWPEQPWTRLHVDYAGPFLGRMYLIVVDAYSKWLEGLPVVNATSHTTAFPVCNAWVTRVTGVKQWNSIYERKIPCFPVKQWYST